MTTPQKHKQLIPPNRYNRFYIEVEPLDEAVTDLIKSGEVAMRMDKIERRDKSLVAGRLTQDASLFRFSYPGMLTRWRLWGCPGGD